MKKFFSIATILLLSASSFAQNTDSTGLDGDDLDLNAVLELFKKSKSLEDFEQKLNEEGNEVNNLDMNDNGYVDYIQVIDFQDSTSESHAVTLRVPVTETESQDVAVIEIEEIDGEVVNLQIVGDEDLYGEEFIVEPAEEGNDNAVNTRKWKPIRHIYGPRYVVWVSPWRFGRYPTWYRPWRRVSWRVYHNRHVHVHRYYRRTTIRRCHRAHIHGKKHHSHSNWYHKNHSHKVSNNPKKSVNHSVTPAKNKKVKTKAATKNTNSANERKRPGGSVKKNNNASDRKRPGGSVKKGNNSNQRKRSGGKVKKGLNKKIGR